MPAGTVLAQEQQGPGAAEPSTLHARFAPEALREPACMSEDLLILLTFIHEAPTVGAAIARFADEREVPVNAAEARLVPPIADALRGGLLEIG